MDPRKAAVKPGGPKQPPPPPEDLIPLGARKRQRDAALGSSSGTGANQGPPSKVAQKPQAPEPPKISSPAAKPAPAQAEKKQEDMLGDTIDPQMVDVLLALAEQEEDHSSAAKRIRETLLYLRGMQTNISATNAAKPPEAQVKVFGATLVHLCKRVPELFRVRLIYEVLVALLGTNTSPFLAHLACQLLYYSHFQQDEWPVDFVLSYVKDLVGPRLWIDQEALQSFVANVSTGLVPLGSIEKQYSAMAVNTEATASSSAASSTASSAPSSTSSATIQQQPQAASSFSLPGEIIDEEEEMEAGGIGGEVAPVPAPAPAPPQPEVAAIRNRYNSEQSREFVRASVIEYLNTQANTDMSHCARLLMIMAPFYPQARFFASLHLEDWLNASQTATQIRTVKEILARIAFSCSTTQAEDLHVVVNFIKMKVKQTHWQLYVDALFQILKNNAAYAPIALKQYILSELFGKTAAIALNVSPIAQKMLNNIFRTMQTAPERAELELGAILQELAQFEEYKPAHLKSLLKVMHLRDLSISAICAGLLSEPKGQLANQKLVGDARAREAWLLRCCDLVTSVVLLSAPTSLPSTDPVYVVRAYREFKIQLSKVQREAVVWCQNVAPRVLPTGSTMLPMLLRKLLFLLPNPAYFTDAFMNASNDDDRTKLMRWVVHEVPVLEEVLKRLLEMYLTQDLLLPPDVLDIHEALVKRAVAFHQRPDMPPMQFSSAEHAESLLLVALLRKAPRSSSPVYSVQIYHVSRFWQACLNAVLLAACASDTIGMVAWKLFRPMRVLMEMLITKTWKYPPLLDGQAEEALLAKEAAMLQEEREMLGESSDLLKIDASTQIRAPPAAVIKRLQQLDEELRLGPRLCMSRKPDFIAELLTSQMQLGRTEEMMKWLGPLIHSHSETYLNILPASLLCELLLLSSTTSVSSSVPTSSSFMKSNQSKMILRLLQLGKDAQIPLEDRWSESLSFLLGRLSHVSLSIRIAAKKTLSVLMWEFMKERGVGGSAFPDEEGKDYSWVMGLSLLVTGNPKLQELTKKLILDAMARESHPPAFYHYITFAIHNTPRDKGPPHPDPIIAYPLLSLVRPLASLIQTRSLVMRQLLESKDLASVCLELLWSAVEQLRAAPRISSNASDADMWILLKFSAVKGPKSGADFAVPKYLFDTLLTFLSLDRSNEKQQPMVNSWTRLLDVLYPDAAAERVKFYLLDHEEVLPYEFTEKQLVALVCSNTQRIVKAAVDRLSATQLVRVFCSNAFGLTSASIASLHSALEAKIQSSQQLQEVLKEFPEMELRRAAMVLTQHLPRGTTPSLFQRQVTGLLVPTKRAMEISAPEPTMTSSAPIMTSSLYNESALPSLLSNAMLRKEIDVQANAQLTLLRHMIEYTHEKRKTHQTSSSSVSTLPRKLLQLLSGDSYENFSQFHSSSIPFVLALLRFLENASEEKSALRTLCQKWLNGKAASLGSAVQICLRTYAAAEQTTVTSLADGTRSAFRSDLLSVPYHLLEQSLDYRILSKDIKTSVPQLLRLLERELSEKSSQKGNSVGLVLDSLDALSGDVISSAEFTESLFSATSALGSSVCSESVLVWLLHRNSHQKLHQLFHRLLSTHTLTSIKATNVLNLLGGYISKMDRADDASRSAPVTHVNPAFVFSQSQVANVASLLLLEAAEKLARETKKETIPTDPTQLLRLVVPMRRLELLLYAAHQNAHNPHALLMHLSRSRALPLALQNGNSAYFLCLLDALHEFVYYAFPEQLWSLQAEGGIALRVGDEAGGVLVSSMDALLHRVMRQLMGGTTSQSSTASATEPSAAVSSITAPAYVLARRLSATHPHLVIRYLPLVASNLQSLKRAFVMAKSDTAAYASSLRVLVHALGILDMLRPFVFSAAQSESVVSSIVDTLIEIAGAQPAAQAREKAVVLPLLAKLFEFLGHYASYRAEHLVRLRPHRVVLENISSAYPELKRASSFLELLHRDDANASPAAPPGSTSLPPMSEFDSLRVTLLPSRVEEFPAAAESCLIDMDRVTLRSPAVLLCFVNELLQLIRQVSEPRVLAIAQRLVVRYLQHNPRDAERVLEVWLECLSSPSAAVRKAALSHAPELFPAAADHAEVFLLRLFQMGKEASWELKQILDSLTRL